MSLSIFLKAPYGNKIKYGGKGYWPLWTPASNGEKMRTALLIQQLPQQRLKWQSTNYFYMTHWNMVHLLLQFLDFCCDSFCLFLFFFQGFLDWFLSKQTWSSNGQLFHTFPWYFQPYRECFTWHIHIGQETSKETYQSTATHVIFCKGPTTLVISPCCHCVILKQEDQDPRIAIHFRNSNGLRKNIMVYEPIGFSHIHSEPW